jgi:dTDP-4-dehydrorhamnose reductase
VISKKKILVLGGSGQLAYFFRVINKNLFSLRFLNRKNFDYLNQKKLNIFIKKNNFYAVINCFAYTDVNRANQQRIKAKKLNFFFVKGLANILKKNNTLLIHFSTDYVYDGNKKRPYKEIDKTNPLNVYGQTKLLADKFLLKEKLKAVIIRTSWLYSYKKECFLKKILFAAKKNSFLKIVNNQKGSPTYAKDLALIVYQILLSKRILYLKKPILFNFSNKGHCTWYLFAKKILQHSNITSCVIKPRELNDTNFSSVVRPGYSVLNTKRIEAFLNINIRNWETALRECLKIKQ